MHAASLNSPRLKDALNALYGRRSGLTSWEWCMKAHFTNPGTVASEINRNAESLGAHWRVVCKLEEVTESGRKIYRYKVKHDAA